MGTLNRRTFLARQAMVWTGLLWLPKAAGQVAVFRRKPPAASSTFTYHATLFSTSDYVGRTGSPTGVVDGSTGLLSVWVKVSTDDVRAMLMHNAGADFGIRRLANNRFEIILYGRLGLISTDDAAGWLTASDGWTHVMAMWDTSDGNKCKIYYGDTDVTSAANNTAGNADYTLADYYFGYENGKRICEFWCGLNQWADIADSAVRGAFRSAGKPKYLGANGEEPTTVAPTFYFKNAYDTVGTNSGSGGDFGNTAGTPADSDSDKP